MHSMVNTVAMDLEFPESVRDPEFGNKVFFKIDIQLSLGQKRILYFDSAS